MVGIHFQKISSGRLLKNRQNLAFAHWCQIKVYSFSCAPSRSLFNDSGFLCASVGRMASWASWAFLPALYILNPVEYFGPKLLVINSLAAISEVCERFKESVRW